MLKGRSSATLLPALIILLITFVHKSSGAADSADKVYKNVYMDVATNVTTNVYENVSKNDNKYSTAAEIDWQPAAEMPSEAREQLPYFCHGRYLEPEITREISELIDATADDAIYEQGKSATLVGDVVLIQGTQEIHSPGVIYEQQSEIADISGPLTIRDSGLLVTGEHATVNLFEGTGVIDQATFLLHQSSFRGKAATIKREKNGHILLDDATLTRCDPGSNVWALNGKDIELEPENGFGTARDVTIRIKDIPLLYLPYLRFPINDDRQSGFLLPNLGYNSDGGTDINIPYYFNLAPNYDATYQLHSLWKRGLVHDGQFRSKTGRTMNEINAAFLSKDDVFDDREIEDQTSADTDTSGVPIPGFSKQDRWLLNVRHEAGWDSRWKTSINYSAVSDVDYLHDIGGNVGSSSVQQFINPVDTNFTNRRSAALDRIGQLQYRGKTWNAELILQGFQSLNPIGAEQYERLPGLSADTSHQFGPIDFDLDLNYTFFDKDNTDLTGPLATTGTRAETDIELSWPLRNVWGFIEPSLGILHRKYNLDDTPLNVEKNPDETTPRVVLDTGLYFDRFFTWGNLSLQQTLEPRLYYLYVEHDEQDDLPQFDASLSTLTFSSIFRSNRFAGSDRIGDARQISLGVTTRFLSEKTGAEFLSASIGQIYFLKDREVLFQPKLADDPTARESALFMQARLALSNGLSIFGTFEWEPDVNRSNRGTFALKYKSGQRKILNFNYIYISPEIERPGVTSKSEESDLNFIWPVANQWSLIGRWNFGWDDNRTIESFIGLEYNDCCWKTRLVIRRFLKEPRSVFNLIDDPDNPGEFFQVANIKTPPDVGIFFEFQLKGLATLGKRLDSLLEDAIPGYRQREDLIGL